MASPAKKPCPTCRRTPMEAANAVAEEGYSKLCRECADEMGKHLMEALAKKALGPRKKR